MALELVRFHLGPYLTSYLEYFSAVRLRCTVLTSAGSGRMRSKWSCGWAFELTVAHRCGFHFGKFYERVRSRLSSQCRMQHFRACSCSSGLYHLLDWKGRDFGSRLTSGTNTGILLLTSVWKSSVEVMGKTSTETHSLRTWGEFQLSNLQKSVIPVEHFGLSENLINRIMNLNPAVSATPLLGNFKCRADDWHFLWRLILPLCQFKHRMPVVLDTVLHGDHLESSGILSAFDG